MPNYSPGPLMHMSLAGFPGVALLIFTVFAFSTLFVSGETQFVLLWITFAAIAVAGAFSLRGWLKEGHERLPAIDPGSTREAEAAPTPIEIAQRRNRRVGIELLFLAGMAVAAIVLYMLRLR